MYKTTGTTSPSSPQPHLRSLMEPSPASKTTIKSLLRSPTAAADGRQTRWTSTKEQIAVLEGLYQQGLRKPTAEQIQQIMQQLRQHGHIEAKNVFYWFGNRRMRERRSQAELRRQESSSLPALSQPLASPNLILSPLLPQTAACSNGDGRLPQSIACDMNGADHRGEAKLHLGVHVHPQTFQRVIGSPSSASPPRHLSLPSRLPAKTLTQPLPPLSPPDLPWIPNLLCSSGAPAATSEFESEAVLLPSRGRRPPQSPSRPLSPWLNQLPGLQSQPLELQPAVIYQQPPMPVHALPICTWEATPDTGSRHMDTAILSPYGAAPAANSDSREILPLFPLQPTFALPKERGLKRTSLASPALSSSSKFKPLEEEGFGEN